jgi:hypothetical protein
MAIVGMLRSDAYDPLLFDEDIFGCGGKGTFEEQLSLAVKRYQKKKSVTELGLSSFQLVSFDVYMSSAYKNSSVDATKEIPLPSGETSIPSPIPPSPSQPTLPSDDMSVPKPVDRRWWNCTRCGEKNPWGMTYCINARCRAPRDLKRKPPTPTPEKPKDEVPNLPDWRVKWAVYVGALTSALWAITMITPAPLRNWLKSIVFVLKVIKKTLLGGK